MAKIVEHEKLRWLRWYVVVLAVLLVAVFYTNLDLYNYTTGLLYPVAPKYVMLALGVLSLPVIWQRVQQRRVWLDDKLLVYVFAVVSIALASLVTHFDRANLEIFEVQVSGLLLLVLSYVVLRDGNALLVARYAVLVCLVLAILISLVEVIYPEVGFSDVPGRAAGLYINPNIAALALNTGLVLAIGLLPLLLRFVILMAGGAAVLGTQSKAGIVVWVVVVIVMWLQGTLRASSRKANIFLGAFAALSFVLLCAFFVYAYTNVPHFRFAVCMKAGSVANAARSVTGGFGQESASETSQRCIRQYDAVVRGGGGLGDVDEESPSEQESPSEEGSLGSYNEQISNLIPSDIASDGISESEVNEVVEALGETDALAARVWILQYATSVTLQNPVWGIGMARAWDLSTHNSYLLYGLAYGVIGWMIVPALALVLVSTGDRRIALPMALILLVWGFFSHNLLMDRTVLLSLALAAATAAIKPEAPSSHKEAPASNRRRDRRRRDRNWFRRSVS